MRFSPYYEKIYYDVYWMITDRDGSVIPWTWGNLKKQSINKFLTGIPNSNLNWKSYYNKGYRALNVNIEPINLD